MTLATDPMQSEKQRRAMFAAAAGRSTLGIPQSVGEKFAEHDAGGKLPKSAKDMSQFDWREMARGFSKFFKFLAEEAKEPEHSEDEKSGQPRLYGAGVMMVAPDGHILFIKRSGSSDHVGEWALPGGTLEDGESPLEAAIREAREEVGDCGIDDKLNQLDHQVMDGVDFTTFVHPVENKFRPSLNDESLDFCWAPVEDPPDPLHPGVRMTLDYLAGDEKAVDAETDPPGKLSETTRQDVDSQKHREDMPEGAFLGPNRTYPVKEKRDGDWRYTEDLLLAAARRARLQGRGDIARRADAIRAREFGNAAEDAGEFDESKHNRDHGKFSATTGGGPKPGLTYYHGTSDKWLSSISQHGLQPPSSGKSSTGIGTAESEGEYVFLGKTLDKAKQYAFMRQGGNTGEVPVILKIKIPRESIAGVEKDPREKASSRLQGEIKPEWIVGVSQPTTKGDYGWNWSDFSPLSKSVATDVVEGENQEYKYAVALMPDGGTAAEDATQLHNREVPVDYSDFMGGQVGTGPDVEKMSRYAKHDLGLDAAPQMAFDRASVGRSWRGRMRVRYDPAMILACDRSMRTKDTDGRLHVTSSHISKAAINPYYGEEIPGYQELNLEPKRKYMLLRDPAELERAADTFNNLPILSEHVPLTALKHKPNIVIGSTGTDAGFSSPYLNNSLVFWTQPAIDAIENDEQRQLSCCYHYVPDMTPGEYEGQPYDGVMRNIRGNHVALVPEGRAGEDVMVMDAMPPRFEEGKHKRDHGKFTSGGGGGGSAAPKRGTNQGYHELLAQHGYQRHEPTQPNTNAVYKHPEGHEVVHEPGGMYTHYYGKGGQRGTSYREGSTHGHLQRTLATAPGKKYVRGTDSRLAGDSKEKDMTTLKLSPTARVVKGALIAYLAPRLAMDSKINLDTILHSAGITTGKKLPAQRTALTAAVLGAVQGKLAADADVDDIAEMLEHVEDLCQSEGEEGVDMDPNSGMPPFLEEEDEAKDIGGLPPAAMEFLKSKLSPEDCAAFCNMMGSGANADPDMADKNHAADDPPAFLGKPEKEESVTKEAMDAAIRSASRATEVRLRGIQTAFADVRPYVGDISHMAFDSAEGVMRHTLKMMQIPDADKLHESALSTILKMQPKPKRAGASDPLAADAAKLPQGVSFDTMFPGAQRITRLG